MLTNVAQVEDDGTDGPEDLVSLSTLGAEPARRLEVWELLDRKLRDAEAAMVTARLMVGGDVGEVDVKTVEEIATAAGSLVTEARDLVEALRGHERISLFS